MAIRFILGLGIMLALSHSLQAQTPAAAATSVETPVLADSVYTSTTVDKAPEFPGGINALNKFLAMNVRYPAYAVQNGISGQVWVSFIVGSDGVIRDITTDQKVGYGCDEEVIRVIQAMPQWIPGEKNGQKVAVRQSLPMNFTLVGGGKKRKSNP